MISPSPRCKTKMKDDDESGEVFSTWLLLLC